MAGRKDKNTVDYFPHYCVSGKTIYVLESKYGNDGYSSWFKILELLGSSENHFVDCRDVAGWEYMQAKMRIESDKLNDILETLANLDAINKDLWSHRIIWSENFVRNINDAYLRRKTRCFGFNDLCMHLSILCEHKCSSTAIDADKNTQSKVKESIVKESEREEVISPPLIQKRFFIEIDELEEFLKSDNQWCEIIAMQNSLGTFEAVHPFIHTFVELLKSRAEAGKTPADAKQHFANWYNAEKKKGGKNGTNRRLLDQNVHHANQQF